MRLLGNDMWRRDRPVRTGRRDKPIIQLPSVALRVAVVIGLAVILFAIVFFRLWFLQILSGQEFVAKANNNTLRSVKIAAARGNIVDRDGKVLVTNRGGQLVGIRLMDVPAGTLEDELAKLAPHLKTTSGKLRETIVAYLKPSTMELKIATVDGAANQATITSATRVGGTGRVVEVTTAAPLPSRLKKGSVVELADLSPDAYNGTFTVTEVVDASHFRVKLSADPGKDASSSGESAVTEKKWESYLRWKDVVAGDITGVDLIPLKEDVNARTRTYLEEHTLEYPGVEVTDEYLRDYPLGNLAAQVLGYTGPISTENLEDEHFKGYDSGDVVGKSGLEYTYDKWLRGRDGVAKVQVDADGHPKSSASVPGGRLAEAGDTLVTTIDTEVQKAAQEALVKGLQLAHADGEVAANGGAAVVLNVKNGDVLAMASYPTYDPSVWVGGISTKKYNRLFGKKSNNYPLLNRATTETKAVGSTFKPIAAVAALEEGVISAGTTFSCPGYFVSAYDTAENPHKYWDWDTSGHGSLDVVGALEQSCDVFFYNVGDRFYARKGTPLEQWARNLGMGRLTGVDVGEAAGRVPTPAWRKEYFSTDWDKQWRPGDSINLSVGQGDLMASPLQLAVAYAAIANGGKVVTPHLGLKIVNAGGQTVRNLEPSGPARTVDISESTLSVVRRGLYQASHGACGTSTAVFSGYKVDVSGKTGTAEVYDASSKHNVDYAWYASYAPSDNPKYAVVVMIERGGHGGAVAAPATRIIYDALFHVDSGEFSGSVTSD